MARRLRAGRGLPGRRDRGRRHHSLRHRLRHGGGRAGGAARACRGDGAARRADLRRGRRLVADPGRELPGLRRDLPLAGDPRGGGAWPALGRLPRRARRLRDRLGHHADDLLQLRRTGAADMSETGFLGELAAAYNYWVTIFLMIAGLYTVAARSNMIKTLVGL